MSMCLKQLSSNSMNKSNNDPMLSSAAKGAWVCQTWPYRCLERTRVAVSMGCLHNPHYTHST